MTHSLELSTVTINMGPVTFGTDRLTVIVPILPILPQILSVHCGLDSLVQPAAAAAAVRRRH